MGNNAGKCVLPSLAKNKYTLMEAKSMGFRITQKCIAMDMMILLNPVKDRRNVVGQLLSNQREDDPLPKANVFKTCLKSLKHCFNIGSNR